MLIYKFLPLKAKFHFFARFFLLVIFGLLLAGCDWKARYNEAQRQLEEARLQIAALASERDRIQSQLSERLNEVTVLERELDQADQYLGKYLEVAELIKDGEFAQADRQIQLIDHEIFTEIDFLISRYFVLAKQEHDIGVALAATRRLYGVSMIDRGSSPVVMGFYGLSCVIIISSLIWLLRKVILQFDFPLHQHVLISLAIAFSVGPALFSFVAGNGMSVLVVRVFASVNTPISIAYGLFGVEDFLFSFAFIFYLIVGFIMGYLMYIVTQFPVLGALSWLLVIFVALQISVVFDALIFSFNSFSTVFIEENIVLILSGLATFSFKVINTSERLFRS